MIAKVVVELLPLYDVLDAVHIEYAFLIESASVQLSLVDYQVKAVGQLQHSGDELVFVVVFVWYHISLV